MKPILELQSVSKKFRISHELKPYLSLRESLMGLFSRNNTSTEDFYALRDVSFDVKQGESIGIIGKNGAGKSTLLKVLSKITPPTTGKIKVRGKIASLLEVGTGFHPELTGRENVYLNGSILGMKRKEIEKQFDAIIDFSGTEKFLDTPLKHYSSGMQLRLAFSVAAFLEPDILIIDEVLAVGDAEFQKKCIGKMEDVSHSGRTILFVSHNLGAVSTLCRKALQLHHGKVVSVGTAEEVITHYLSGQIAEKKYESEGKGKNIFLESAQTFNSSAQAVSEFGYSETLTLRLNFRIREGHGSFKAGLAVLDRNKTKVFTHHFNIEKATNGVLKLECVIPAVLCPGNFSFDVAAFVPNVVLYDYVQDICPVTIIETGSDMFQDKDYGQVFIPCQWKQIE